MSCVATKIYHIIFKKNWHIKLTTLRKASYSWPTPNVEEQNASQEIINNICQVQKNVHTKNAVLSSAWFKKKQVPTKKYQKKEKKWFKVKQKMNKKYGVKVYQKQGNVRTCVIFTAKFSVQWSLFLFSLQIQNDVQTQGKQQAKVPF